MTQMSKRHSWAKRAVGIAAALVLLAGGVVGFHAYNTQYAVASTISLEVNPSIEIKANQNDQVLDVVPLNDDARTVVGDMDFKGSDIEVTLNALIGSMLRNGYLSDIANSILVSVDNDDAAAGTALQKKVTEAVNALLQTDQFEGAVLSQTVSHDSDLQQLAETYGITTGKAQLIRQITSQNTLHTFEELVPLSVNELNLISHANQTTLENVESVGTASEKKYIGRDKAKSAALTHAGVAASAVRDYEVELDYEQGTMVYEIEFSADRYDYDYDIDAVSGDVLRNTKEAEDDWYDDDRDDGRPATSTTRQENKPTDHAATTAANAQTNAKPTQTTPQSNTQAPTTTAANQYIGREAAKAAALAHAGVTADAVRDFECELDRDDGRAVYEIEFSVDRYDYEYEINAKTGAVERHEKDRND